MLRPKKMSKVSVAGSKAVLEDVIEEMHELNLVHVIDYDGSWEGFENGNPLEGGDEVSGKLVQVRAVINTLDVDEDDYDPDEGTGFETREELRDRFADLRERVNELEDERSEVRDALREAREERRTLEPFVELGIDVELLRGYNEIDVRVGQGDVDDVREALEGAEGEEYEIFEGDGVVAVAARGIDLEDLLVGVGFSEIDVPEEEGSPSELLDEVESRIERLEDELDEIQSRMDEIRDENANFLLAAEEELSIEAQKTDAPLHFATTTNSFYSEGWIPHDKLDEMVKRLHDTVGNHVDVQELDRVEYDDEGHPEQKADGESAESTNPPVVQDNPDASKPFELLVNAVNRPSYTEIDPTVIVFLTFPLGFGFMIGDVGYGLLYAAIGYYIYVKYDSPGLKSIGGVGIWAGAFTIIFGILYGEFLGLHFLGEMVWGHPPIKKGLQASEFALLWLTVSLIIALVHVNLGYIFGFINEMSHDFKEAVLENASWMLLMNGVWIWVFSRHMKGSKPPFIYEVFDGEPIALGFSGLPEVIGYVGLVGVVVGMVLLVMAEGGVALPESLQVLVNVLSYARIPAVLLAKAGMAFIVNLLVFGIYEHDGELHFMLGESASHIAQEYGSEAVLFRGMFNLGEPLPLAIVGIVFGITLFVLGHVIVLALGITSAGLQALRLEYVEFFGKFYEGGGEKYQPFGCDRKHTKEN